MWKFGMKDWSEWAAEEKLSNEEKLCKCKLHILAYSNYVVFLLNGKMC